MEQKLQQAIALHQAGRLADAERVYIQILQQDPDHIDALHLLGMAALRTNRPERGIRLIEKVIRLDPRNASAHNNRGVALRDLGRFAEAIAGYDRAIALEPDSAASHNNRGVALKALARLAEALASYDKAIALKPDYAEAYSNRGTALHDLGRCDEAIASCERAIALNPRYAGAYYTKSLACLATGDLATAWKLHEDRKQVWDVSRYRPYPQPIWLGKEDPAGKTVFLYWEQGLGDTIPFCRYAALLQALGAHVVMSVQQPLVRLLRQLALQIEIIGADQEPVAFDLHCPLMSLPLAFGTTLETIPSAPRYLASDPRLHARWAARLPPGTRPRIGLAWSGYAHHPNDQHRSIYLSALKPLFSLDVDWFCLQKEFRAGEAEALKAWSRITLLDDELEDFADTAAAIDQLDLVIAVDTSVAHLAGALGKPVWILLAFSPDWRWLLAREDTPWYPSARLHRQPRIDDWPAAVAQVKSALAARFLS